MTTIKLLAAALKAADSPLDRLEAALALLKRTQQRQYVEAALAALNEEDVLAMLDDFHRDVLRERVLALHDGPPEKDSGAAVREQLTRLLVYIGNPNDTDVYLRGAMTYYRQPRDDVAQNLRAASLVGLAAIDRNLACWHAARLLGEDDTSVFNGEPSITAIDVLARFDHMLTIYAFIRLRGMTLFPRWHDPTAHAFIALGKDLPDTLLREAAEPFLEADAAVVLSGVLNAIVTHRRESLYHLIDRALFNTTDENLHNFVVILLATSRDDVLTNRLLHLAGQDETEFRHNYHRALEFLVEKDARKLEEQLN